VFRSTAYAVASALTLAAALTACGGHEHPGATPTPTPTAVSSASPSPSATRAGASVPPKAVLPKGFRIVVDGGKTGDPAKDAVLAANLAQYEATFQAIDRQDPEDPLYKEWTGREGVTVDAQQSTKAYIEEFVKDKQTSFGTLRIYDERVSSMTAMKAHLTWCEDQTKTYAKVIATGKVLYTKPSRNDYTYYRSTLWKQKGRWITVWVQSFEGDARCA
jgi:hypothetical protein